MKTISDYSIFCTEEQTRKALELGAPIRTFGYGNLGDVEDKILKLNKQCVVERDNDNCITVSFLPTAEQIIGWLGEQGVLVDIAPYSNNKGWCFYINYEIYMTDNLSREEATIAAIDAALKYLTSKK